MWVLNPLVQSTLFKIAKKKKKKKNPESAKKHNFNLQHAGNYIHLHTFITIYNAGNTGSDTTK